MSSGLNLIRIPRDVVRAIETHAANCAPNECCGLLATDPVGEIRFAYPLSNTEASPQSFTVDPDESYGAFMHADRLGWRIGGVFHSHPSGPDRLSERDIDSTADPAWIHLLQTGGSLSAWRVEGRAAIPIETELR